ncbi:MFS transporter [Bounagaea algeriensis]
MTSTTVRGESPPAATAETAAGATGAGAGATGVGGGATDRPMTHRQVMQGLVGLLLALLVAMLSSTIVSNALPRITADLNGSQGQYAWVVSAMLLTSTATTPLWGKLSDLVSKKLLYQVAIVIFTLGSVLGGFSQSMGMLIGFRAVQGIGMGGLQALAQVVLAAMVPPAERGRYTGYIGATFALATVAGPLLGGFIVDSPLGWRWCFWITVPIAVIAFLVLGRVLKLPVVKRDVKVDWFGALFLVGGVSALLIWVSMAGNQFAWWSQETAWLVAGGVVAVLIALVIETRVREPIVPLGMFRNRTTSAATIGMVAVGTAMFGGTVFLSQYFQLSRGFSPTGAGLMTLPMVFGMFVSTTVSGQIIARVTGRIKPFLVSGAAVMIVAMYLLSTMDSETDLVLVGCYLALMGIGVGMLMQNLVLAVQNATSSRDMGSVTSVVTFFRTLGGSAGVSVLGAVLATRLTGYIQDRLAALGVPAGAASGAGGGSSTLDVGSLPEPVKTIVQASYGDAIGDLFFISACIAVVTFIAVLFIKEVPLRTTIHTEDEWEATPVAAQEAAGAHADTTAREPGVAREEGVAREAGVVASARAAEQPTAVLAAVGESTGSDGIGPRLHADPVHTAAATNGAGVGPAAAVGAHDDAGGLFVHGTVRDAAGGAVTGVVLTLTDANGRQAERGRSDEHGQFQLPVAGGGTYVLIASGGNYQPSASMVVVGDRPVRHDVQLSGAAELSGTVHDGHRGVAGAVVVLTDVRGEVVASGATGPDGRYAIGELVGGTYALTATAPGCRPVAAQVALGDGERAEHDVALQSGSQMSGVVRSAVLGVAIPDARVTLLDGSGAVVAAARTDVDGRYGFTDLPEGEYTMITTGFPPVAGSLQLHGEQVEHDVDLGHPEGQ